MEKSDNKTLSKIDSFKKAFSRFFQDNYVNPYSGFGGSNDPLSLTSFKVNSSLARETLAVMYRFDWVAKKFINIIANDATNKWIEFTSDDVDLVSDVNNLMDELDVKEAFTEALVLSRLYGGSIIIPGILDGRNISEPLNWNNIQSINFMNVLDRYQVHIVKTFNDPMQKDFGKPELYSLQPINRGSGYLTNFKNMLRQNQIIHSSRVIRLDGAYIPDLQRISNEGWNDSYLIDLESTLKAFGVSIHSLSVLFMDFITKVLKMPDLSDLLQDTEGKAALEGRISYMARKMSSIGIAVIGENEEFDKKQTPVSGLDKIFDKMMEILSGATNIPRARFFSQQLGKLAGATEENNKYYQDISSYQENKLRNPIKQFLRMVLNSKDFSTKGKEPENWNFSFKPLMEMDDKTRSEYRKNTVDWVAKLIESAVITPEEATVSLFSPSSTGFSDQIIIEWDLRKKFEETENINNEEINNEEI
jgi:phage-related protein (TIGR01555 family)